MAIHPKAIWWKSKRPYVSETNECQCLSFSRSTGSLAECLSVSCSLSELAWRCQVCPHVLISRFGEKRTANGEWPVVTGEGDRSLIEEKEKRSSVMSLSHDDCIHFSLSSVDTCKQGNMDIFTWVGSFELIFGLTVLAPRHVLCLAVWP